MREDYCKKCVYAGTPVCVNCCHYYPSMFESYGEISEDDPFF